MGFLRPYGIALTATLALLIPAPSSAQQAPIDPVSGLAIPLLPGQVFEQVKKGCWVIDNETSFAYLKTRWIGACRYGVIDGPGLLVYPGYDGKPETHVQVNSHLGQILSNSILTDYWVFIPRTADHPLWEELRIVRRNLDGQRDMSNPSIPAATVVFVTKNTRDNAFQHVREELTLQKKSCPADSVNSRDIQKYFSPESFNSDGFSEKDISRLTEFCLGAVKRLRGDAWAFGSESFDNVDYGHYHFASLKRQVERLRHDGQVQGTAGAVILTNTPSLCPDLSTPVGCEAVWQRLLAPYEAEFAQLKPKEAAAEAARRADTERRFAPHKQAWRAKIADLRTAR
jgi:hypothetical protein